MEAGIVGLPNVGKSTLFNALTAAGIPSENYPFCTIEPNVGVVAVPDARLEVIEGYIPTQKVIPAILRLVDIAGLVRGASKGEGLGNKFLSHIKNVDAVLHAARAIELLGPRAREAADAMRRARQRAEGSGMIEMFIRFSADAFLKQVER